MHGTRKTRSRPQWCMAWFNSRGIAVPGMIGTRNMRSPTQRKMRKTRIKGTDSSAKLRAERNTRTTFMTRTWGGAG